MSRSLRLAVAALFVLSLAALPASGTEAGEPRATALSGVEAALAGDTLEVSGAVSWGEQAPVLVGWGPSGSAVDPETKPLGVDLINIYISQPDGNVDELEFIWEVSELNVPPPHEVVRYLWQMRVGTEVYWLQAKMSDLTTGTNNLDDPVGGATHVLGSFRLRGDCGALAEGAPVNTCRHLAFMDGVFDIDADQIRMTVPLDLEFAEHFTAGNRITNEAQGAEAGFQVVISNSSTTKSVPLITPYTIASKDVTVALVDAQDETAASTVTAADADGAFSAALDTTGLDIDDYELVVTACFAGSCDSVTPAVQR